MMASYFFVFYFSTMYDTNDSGVLTLSIFRPAKKYSHLLAFSAVFLLSQSLSSISSAIVTITTVC
jgi:hypothetical protein